MTVIYTGIFGGYDSLKPHPEIEGVRFVAFTDIDQDPNGWELELVDPQGRDPRALSKHYKMSAHTLFPEEDCWIWVDGSIQITSELFALYAQGAVKDANLALFYHPERDCIYSEALVSDEYGKYRDQKMLQQAVYYAANGHPAHWGLWATGIIARKPDPFVDNLMEAWKTETINWSYQCQVSLPFISRIFGIRPDTIPGNIYDSPFLVVHPHA